MARSALQAACAVVLLAGCVPHPPWRALSPDHRTAFEAIRRGRRTCVTVAARPEGCFDGVALDAVVFSERGGHIAYPALTGSQWSVVRDGRAGPAFDGIGALAFSADGSRLAYAALRDLIWRVVVDDTAGPPFDSLFAGSLVFDPTGRRLAYVAQRNEAVVLVVDGLVQPGWQGVGRVAFSADGEHLAWTSRQGGQVTLVVDGVAGPAHDALSELVFAPTGGELAYAARRGGFWFVVGRGTASGPWTSARAVRFRPWDGALAFIARMVRREAVVLNGVRGPWWDSIEVGPVFAASSPRWGYVARDSAGAAIVVDGAEVGRERLASDLAFSADGGRFAYVARRADSAYVMDDRGAHPFDVIVEGSLLFLADGRTWACLAGDRARRRFFVVLDGTPYPVRFDWAEVLRLAARAPGDAVVRAWVAAEAEALRAAISP